MCEFFDHTLEKAEVTLRAALVLADDGFDDVRLLANMWLGEMFQSVAVLDRRAEAKPFLWEAEELAPKVDDPISRGWWSLIGFFWPHWEGRFDNALKHLALWRDAAEKTITTLIGNRWVEALARGGKGEYQQALAILDDVLATCERTGGVVYRARALNTVGWIYTELQDHQRAVEWNTRGVEAAVEANFPDPEVESNARLNLGDNLLALGRPDEAEEQFKKVERVVRNPGPTERFGLWRYSQHLFHSYGELWLARGDYDKALAYAGECLALAEQSDSKKNIVKGRRLRGQVFLAQGKLVEAEKELAAALKIAEEIGNPPQLWKTRAALGDPRQAQGKRDDARKAYRDALAVIEGVAAGLEDESLRETFLNSDHVQDIRRSADDVS
jgi:tetratricopeptide (TPR) repeat protein